MTQKEMVAASLAKFSPGTGSYKREKPVPKK